MLEEEQQDEQPQPERNGHVAARLDQLERAIGEQSARMRRIEERLGLVDPPAAPRAFGQGVAAAAVNAAAPPVNAAPPSVTESRGRFETDEPAVQGRAFESDLEPVDAAAPQAPPIGRWSASAPAAEEERVGGERAADSEPRADREERGGEGTRAGAAAARSSWVDLETSIGGSWFNWIGIVALTLGVAFFLKLAFDNQWIGPTGRVLLGGAAGCSLLALAEWLRARDYRSYAHVLSGGGILILYLSVYAAYNFYQLIGQPPAFLLMAAVTATAVLLAARYDALPIAILGLLGGFMTPLLLSRNVDNQIALFGYIALLDAGVLALAYFKQWRSLNYLSFAATVLMFAGWAVRWYADAKLWPTLFFLTLFFVMFSALALLHNVLKQRLARWLDISLIVTNATLYFAASYGLMSDYLSYSLLAGRLSGAAHLFLGAHALLVAGFYALLFSFAESRHREDKLLSLSYAGAAVTFLTIAVAIVLDQHWATIGWAVEGLLLTWIGFRTNRAAPRYAALPVLAVAVTHWFTVDLPDSAFHSGRMFWPLLNARAVSCAALIATFAGSYQLYRRHGERIEKDERDILGSVFVLAIFVLGLTLLTSDVEDYFRQRQTFFSADDQTGLAAFENTRRFTVTTLWLLYGALALALGVVRRLLILRLAALLLLSVAILNFIANDVHYYDSPWHLLFFNQTFAGFAIVVAALASCAFFYARAGERVGERERAVVLPILVGAANLAALAGLSLEVMGYFNRVKALAWSLPDGWMEATRVENWKQLTLSVLWIVYGIIAFVVGLRRRQQYIRFGALGLLALTGAKILLVDAAYYNAAWHVPIFNQTFAAFACYILALAFVFWLYTRDGSVDADERQFLTTGMTIAANVLAIVALSLEAAGYFEKLMRLSVAVASEQRDLQLARQLSLSVIWAVYGGALLVVGLLRRTQLLRVMALLLLGLTISKVFFLDLSALDKIYRIVSFIVLGAILLVVSFLYQQRQRRAARAGNP